MTLVFFPLHDYPKKETSFYFLLKTHCPWPFSISFSSHISHMTASILCFQGQVNRHMKAHFLYSWNGSLLQSCCDGSLLW